MATRQSLPTRVEEERRANVSGIAADIRAATSRVDRTHGLPCTDPSCCWHNEVMADVRADAT